MGLAEEVIAVWGKEKVQRASLESVATLNIPTSSKDFLVKVGLPREDLLVIRFELERNPFATLAEHARAKNLPSPKRSEQLRVLAYGNCAPDLCIDECARCRVIKIDLE
jgi:hypothetical protein